ncbi:Na/Pi cotransporter family protein [Desulfallas thermosapovorans]|uniref:Phosphate:Na+ symporter n=1 Tax=Desulfallas thermosapovorans DSM 6562 TaxID=1121431 RepID=A0A5S4ZPX0_9FIRM|nr:Na/Pi cotransporter family protein [Desulfallas thermosapovorans]TYO94942.1 phosphate:Na+ symporter [Desulfallas thermosapovorans DSM 6562]
MELWKTVVLGLLGGMGLLLYGMFIMSEGLQKVAGHRLRSILSTLTHNRFTALIVGALVTMLFQSSTATTVILVGLTSASIMSLKQTLGVILGADIGTTVTAQLIALKVTEISLPIVGIGAAIIFFSKRDKYKRVGQVLLGFGLLFLGLKMIADTMQPLKDEPFFRHILLSTSDYPLLAVAAAAVFTFLIQSSAASVGIIMVMSMQHLVSLHSAIYLLLGANIGTSFTALLTSLGSSREAQRVATAHLLFKLSGVLLMLPFVNQFAILMAKLTASPGYQVANAHTLFNIGIAMVFLPFIKYFAKLLEIIIPERQMPLDEQLKPKYLDDKLISTPSIALGLASKEINHAADQVFDMIQSIIKIFEKSDIELLDKINKKEDYLDVLCKSITNYLTSVMRQPLSRKEFYRSMSHMHIINDLEHIGDIIEKDITYIASCKITRQCQFSDAGWEEIKEMHQRLGDLMRMANVALASNDTELAGEALKRYPELARMERRLRAQHFNRLRDGTTLSISTSALHLDLINSFLRISEHIRNICHEIIHQGNDGDVTDHINKVNKTLSCDDYVMAINN